MGNEERRRSTILVAEDDDDTRQVLAMLLRDSGACVVEARTGIEAVEAATRGRPSIVLMDLSMPGMNGIEAARRIRQEAALRSVPIIFLTAHGDYGIKLFGESELMDSHGPFEYLTKPLDPSLLAQILDKYLG
jgi:CheY-like chemotaxis protein